MRRSTSLCIVIASVVASVLLPACNNKPQPAAPKTTTASTPSAFKMALTTVPDPPLNDKTTTFRVHVTDLDGKPVTGAQVKAALIMLTMDMGKNEVALADKGDGNYEGSGKFNMAGPWNVDVTAVQGDKKGQQTFPMGVKL